MNWNVVLYAVLAVVFITRVVDAWTRGSTALAFAFAAAVVASVMQAVRALRKMGNPR